MMKRDQFTFYRSYYEAIRNLSQRDQLKVIMAICSYALDEEPPSLSGIPFSVFTLIQPTLDSGRKKAANRKNKTKTKQEQNRKEKEGECEVEREVEGEVEGDYPSTATLLTSGSGVPPLAAVARAYMDRINPTPSPTSMEELSGYVKSLGAAVCLRAIDRAIDAGKPFWNYIRGTLRRLEASGVKCLADWDRLDAEHQGAVKQARGAGGPVDGPNVSLDDVDLMAQAAQWAAEQGGEK